MTRRNRMSAALVLSLTLWVFTGADCPSNGGGDMMPGDGGGDMMPGDGGDGGDGGDNNGANLTVVKTGVALHVDKRIEAGDGIIVFGTGGFAGVDYINVGDTAGQGIPNGDNFVAGSFAVAGKKAILIENFLLTVFNTVDGTSEAIAQTDIRLQSVPAGINVSGHIMADGNFVGTMNDPIEVADGKRIKVVDVSGATPQVISFDNDPASAPEQLDVDASNPHLAVVANNIIYVYDIDNPGTAPQQFDMTAEGGVAATQIQFKNGLVLFHDNSAKANTKILDTSDGTVMTLAENPSNRTLGLNGGKYCYFVDRDTDDSQGTVYRAGTGEVTNATPTLAGDTRNTAGTDNNGFVGWGETTDITPDGDWIFVAGERSIGQQEFLMVSQGGGFSLINDPDGGEGLKATDVSTSASLAAFKVGNNADTFVGYIELP